MGENGKLRNKLLYLCLTDIQNGCYDNSMGEIIVFSTNGAGTNGFPQVKITV